MFKGFIFLLVLRLLLNCQAVGLPAMDTADVDVAGALSNVRGEDAKPPGNEHERMIPDRAEDPLRRDDLLLAEVLGQRKESATQFAFITDQFALIRDQFALIADQYVLLAKQVVELRQDQAFDRAENARRFDSVNRRFDSVNDNLFELLSSTQTPRSAAHVDACAQRSVLHIEYPLQNKTHPGICSAFAYRHDPNKTVKIVTAAHCFAEFVPGADITLLHLGDSIRRTCIIMQVFLSPLDAAVLSCTNVSSFIGLLPSVGTRLSQVVAIAGFTNDSYVQDGYPSHHLYGLPMALNVDFARIVSVAGPLKNSDGSVCVSSPDFVEWVVSPSGFVDRRVTAGLSGGPVLDLQCGVVGIANGRSCDAGVFMSLAPIDEYLSTMSE